MIRDIVFCALIGWLVAGVAEHNYPRWVNWGYGLLVALATYIAIWAMKGINNIMNGP